MQRVSPVFEDDNTFLQQCGVWDSLLVWVFWIKWVKNKAAVVRGICVVDGEGRCCGFHGILCYSLLRAAWLSPDPCWAQMCLTHSYQTNWACVWRLLGYWLHGVVPDSSEFGWAAAHPSDWFPVCEDGTPEWRLSPGSAVPCLVMRVWSKVLPWGWCCVQQSHLFIDQCQQDVCWCVPSRNYLWELFSQTWVLEIMSAFCLF